MIPSAFEMSEVPPMNEAPPSEEEVVDCPDWDSLPINCLVQIFDDLLRAPTPHPSYLPGKLKVGRLKPPCKLSWPMLIMTPDSFNRVGVHCSEHAHTGKGPSKRLEWASASPSRSTLE
jgi:hypothetical protein